MSSPRSAEPENPSRKEFAAIVKAYLVENGICNDAILNVEQFTLVCQSDNEWDAQTFLLANAYEDYCQVQIEDRPKVIAHYFAHDDAIPTELARAIDNVLPHIQARGSFDIIKLTPKSENDNVISDAQAQIPLRVIGEHFQLSLVYDTPKSMSHLNQKVLESWGIGFEELMERAQKNLAAITPEPFRQITAGIYCSPYSDNHDVWSSDHSGVNALQHAIIQRQDIVLDGFCNKQILHLLEFLRLLGSQIIAQAEVVANVIQFPLIIS